MNRITFGNLLRPAAFAIFAAIGIFSSGVSLADAWRQWRAAPELDEVSETDRRFAPVLDVIPPGSVIGYITDVPHPAPIRELEMTVEYYRAQYAVAPIVLHNSPAPPILLGNFKRPEAAEAARRDPHLEIIHEFDGGLILFLRRNHSWER